MTTFYLDEMGGNDTLDGTSYANRWRTITAGPIAARIAPGDTIRIMKSPDPESIGNATWTNGSPAITLSRSYTSTIENCETLWTQSANVTATINTANVREGYGCASLSIAAGFSTGIVGYKATATTLDLSAYQQVSFWVRVSNPVSQGVLALHLCSDNAGATPVNKIDIPNIPTINVWQNVTVPFMANLGNSIQSISLYAISDPGTVVVLLDNIIACKAPPSTVIDSCDGAWTQSAKVTQSNDTTNHREGTGCISLAIAAGFTTGLIAYKATGTLDLSSYQEVWLRIRTSVAISTVNYLNISLCSDNAGATPVNTFNIRALPTTGAWYTLQLVGGNLGNSIQSVALSSTNDFGAATILLDSIIAVKTYSNTVVDSCDAGWTGSANVTATTDTANEKEGTGCASLAIASGFATGLIAYKATGTLNLSSYQQISFWIRSNIAIPASTLTLTLCSDNAGATPVNTFSVPAITSVDTWTEFSIDAGGNMGDSIASVALNAIADPGTVTILIDNIRTNCYVLTLSSLISKNITNECWYGILSINGTTIMIDNGGANTPLTTKGYIGTGSVSTTTYVRECQKPSVLPMASGTWEAIQDTGSDGLPITFSGGWNATDMSTQTGETFFDGQNFTGTGLVSAARHFITLERLNFVRFGTGINPTTGSFLKINGDTYVSNCSASGFVSTTASITIENLYSFGNVTYGASFTTCHNTSINKLIAQSNASSGIYINGTIGFRVKTALCACNNTNGVQFVTAANCVIYNAFIANCTTAGINHVGTNNYFIGCELDNATDVASTTFHNSQLYVQESDKINHYHQIYSDGVIISSKTGIERNTTTGLGWEIAAINATRTYNNPILFKIATVACVANEQRTITAYIKRNTTLATAQLFIPKNQATGLTSDLSTTATGALSTYQQETINFTPTAQGVVDIYIKAYAFVPFIVYVDDIVGT